MSTLQHRAHRQQVSLHRWIGARTFFRHHPVQAVSRIGRREVRRARVWIRVIRRELAETRDALIASSRQRMSVPEIICAVFRGACAEALAVASCESHYFTGATNGQYFGVFQMGSAERARFGGSSLDPWEQVRAAYAYWRVAGWAPWSCA